MSGLLSLYQAAKIHGIGTALLRSWVENQCVRGIPVERTNAKDGVTYKFIPDQLNEDIGKLSTAKVVRPTLFVDIKESIRSMFQ